MRLEPLIVTSNSLNVILTIRSVPSMLRRGALGAQQAGGVTGAVSRRDGCVLQVRKTVRQRSGQIRNEAEQTCCPTSIRDKPETGRRQAASGTLRYALTNSGEDTDPRAWSQSAAA